MNKKGAWSVILAFILLALVLFLIVDYLFGQNTIKGIAEKVRNIFEVQETDPTVWERKFYNETREGINYMASVVSSFRKVANAKDKDGNEIKVCFGTFEIPKQSFYENMFSLRFSVNEANDGTVVLLQRYYEQRVNPDNTASTSGWYPVTSTISIDGYFPCAIYGEENINYFYNDILKDANVRDPYLYGMPLYSFSISPMSRTTSRITSFVKTVAWLAEEGSVNEYEVQLHPGDSNRLFVVKLDKHLCIIPTINLASWGCDKPNPGNKAIDEDCLDGEKKSFFFFNQPSNEYKLPSRLKNELKDFVCPGFEEDIKNLVE